MKPTNHHNPLEPIVVIFFDRRQLSMIDVIFFDCTPRRRKTESIEEQGIYTYNFLVVGRLSAPLPEDRHRRRVGPMSAPTHVFIAHMQGL